MTIVSRLQLDHPTLGTAGGAALHSTVESLFTKIGDNTNARFFTQDALADTADVDFTHNFKTAFNDLRYDLYIRNTGTGELSEITEATTPNISQFTVIATPGFTTTQIRVTNNSGAPRDIAMAVIQDPINLRELSDVDLSTLPEDGQALVYDVGGGQWKPGASGDASFKLQGIAVNVATVKAGSIYLDDGRELYLAADITFDLKTQVHTDGVTAPGVSTAYYVYLDLNQAPVETLVGTSDRKVYAVTSGTAGMFVVLATAPEQINLGRYVPLYSLKTDGSSDYTEFSNLAFRRHQQPSVAVSPVVETIGPRSIGSVGAVANAQGALVDGDFPSTTGLHYWHMNSDVNDDGPNTAANLTGTTSFSGNGFFGRENLEINGGLSVDSSEFLYDFSSAGGASLGGWFYSSDWSEAVDRTLIGWGKTDASEYFILQRTNSQTLRVLNSSSPVLNPGVSTVGLSPGWHHVAAVVENVSGTTVRVKIYIDGSLGQTSADTDVGGTWNIASLPRFTVGRFMDGSQVFAGAKQDLFNLKNSLTAAQIDAIYSKRFTNNTQIAAGHKLTNDSFPFASLTDKVSYWNLDNDDGATILDDSGNGKGLTKLGSLAFTGLNKFGAVGSPRFDAVDDYLSSTDPFFNPTSDVSIGGWYNLDGWDLVTSTLFIIGDNGPDASLFVFANNLKQIEWRVTSNNATWDFTGAYEHGGLNGWHHVAVTYGGGYFNLYLDGVKVGSQAFSTRRVTTSPLFRVGTHTGVGSFIRGTIEDIFFTNKNLTDADIRKLYSARIDLANSVPADAQKWDAYHISEDGRTINEYDSDWLVDKKDGAVYADFGGASGNKVTLRLSDLNLSSRSISSRSFARIYTSTPPASVAHGLAEIPTGFAVLHDELADGKYVPLPTSNHIKSDATNLYLAGFDSLTVDATHPVKIVASVAPASIAFVDATSGTAGINKKGKIWVKEDASLRSNLALNSQFAAGNLDVTDLVVGRKYEVSLTAFHHLTASTLSTSIALYDGGTASGSLLLRSDVSCQVAGLAELSGTYNYTRVITAATTGLYATWNGSTSTNARIRGEVIPTTLIIKDVTDLYEAQ